MEYHDPQSPKANQPGDHPQMGERKGNWKVLFATLALAILGVFGAAIYFGAL